VVDFACEPHSEVVVSASRERQEVQTIARIQTNFIVLLRELSATEGWVLDDEMLSQYGQAIQPHLSDQASSDTIAWVATNYHHDHQLVEALNNHAHAQHEQQWQALMADVLRILRRSGLDWSADDAVELEDLAQVARLSLMRSLPAYRYQSRFSTWIYSVIVRTVRTYLRDIRAAKRAGRRQSLEALGDPGIPARDGRGPEAHGEAVVLTMLINDILRSQPDPRLVQIFHLWAIEDQRAVAIGQRMHLSPSRVRALIQECVGILRASPDIHAWIEGGAGQPDIEGR
jgi:RNA polymerase sigma factor (sigma-70 family)